MLATSQRSIGLNTVAIRHAAPVGRPKSTHNGRRRAPIGKIARQSPAVASRSAGHKTTCRLLTSVHFRRRCRRRRRRRRPLHQPQPQPHLINPRRATRRDSLYVRMSTSKTTTVAHTQKPTSARRRCNCKVLAPLRLADRYHLHHLATSISAPGKSNNRLNQSHLGDSSPPTQQPHAVVASSNSALAAAPAAA